MDVLAHTLWTNALFHVKYHNQRRQRYIAAFFGVVPDLISFVPLTIYLSLHFEKFSPTAFVDTSVWAFNYASQSYNYTHSMVIFLAVFLIVTAIRRGKVYWPMFGWALHILIDIFTHKDFFETPFLFPLSNYTNHHAIIWAHPIFMIVNYSLMALVYVFLFWYQSKQRKKNHV